MTWAFDSGLPPGPRFVLVVLGEHAGNHSGEDWTCYPSVNRIHDRTGQGVSTIERHLTFLWLGGWISRVPRIRKDGRLGINDFTLHRRAETREALKARREGADRKPGRRRQTLEMRDGPSLDMRVANPQNETQPTLDLRGHEPSSEPLTEPSQGAREPGDEGFDRLAAVWPKIGRKRTKWPQARAAFARWAQECGAEALIEAARACAADPDLAKGDFGWPGLHNWLGDEGFREWLGSRPAEAEPARTEFEGPPILRFEIVEAEGEAFATAYLDRCRWDPDARALQPATAYALTKLAERAAAALRRHGVSLTETGGTNERHA